MIYTVKPGDTVYLLSERFHIPSPLIVSLNGLTDPDHLSVGQSLLLLKPNVTHTVVEGDTLYSVARHYGTSVNQLLRNNPYLHGSDQLMTGQTLIISYDEMPDGRCLTVNGFAFPSMKGEVLNQTLPHLSHITPFAYGFEASGRLVTAPDDVIVQSARSNGVSPVLLLSSLNTDGNFDNSLSHLLLGDRDLQDILIEEILETMWVKGYKTLLVDFEYLFAEYRDRFTEFIKRIKNAFLPYGYEIWVSLAPRISTSGDSLLYEGHDYSALGAIADRLILMSFEWGYTYGKQAAVAPLDLVRESVDYALTQIPPEKLILGIPAYGQDSSIGDTHEKNAPMTLTYEEALALAFRKNAAIQFDQAAMSPYFLYQENGIQHKVWFEDARSFAAKLSLVNEKGLSGISLWNLMNYPPQVFHSLLSYCHQ